MFYISFKSGDASVFAPLFLKKVSIEIEEKDVILKTLDETTEINEKLLFVLENELKVKLPRLEVNNSLSFKEAVDIFLSKTKLIKGINKYIKPFDFDYDDKVATEEPKVCPGVVLAILNPSEGLLRERLVAILKDKEKTEHLLKIDHSRDVKKEVEDDLRNEKGLFRITMTDLSQEKAILGSMKDHSIIWGPPGTGKSQTICNILANLLYLDKKVIVTSEKKAALDVLKERMGKLSKYTFLGLVNKHMDKKGKKNFYKSFQDLLEVLDEKSKIRDINALPYLTKPQLIFDTQKA